MRYSKEHKQETHRRILHEAARQLRERGLDTVSVAEVMAGVGLTHGGFYAHFPSKEELIAEALHSVRTTPRGNPVLSNGSATDSDAQSAEVIKAMVKGYLSVDHCEGRGTGCVVAALGAEAPKHSSEARRVLASRAHQLAQAFLPHLEDKPGQSPEEQATGLAAALVGGLILARLEMEPANAERVLAACQRFIFDALKLDEPQRTW